MLGSEAVSAGSRASSGNLRAAESPETDDLGFPRGRDRVEHGLAGGSAAVVAKGEVVAFRLAVREALDQRPGRLPATARWALFWTVP